MPWYNCTFLDVPVVRESVFVRVMRHKGQTSNAVLTQMTPTLKNGLFRASSAVVAKLTAFTAHPSSFCWR